MIDTKLIKAAISAANLTTAGLNSTAHTSQSEHTLTAIEELQRNFNGITSADDPKAISFDCFGFAWNRLPRSERFRLISDAYRQNNTIPGSNIFADIKLDQSVNWENFSLPQQSALIKTCSGLVTALVSLFSDESFAVDYRGGFIGSLEALARSNAAMMGIGA